jgi:hypothetical protein
MCLSLCEWQVGPNVQRVPCVDLSGD